MVHHAKPAATAREGYVYRAGVSPARSASATDTRSAPRMGDVRIRSPCENSTAPVSPAECWVRRETSAPVKSGGHGSLTDATP